jgi:hypothetical protein
MKSMTNPATIVRLPSRNRSALTNGSRLLPGIDGRSAAARRFRDICANYEAEVGADITETERDLIRHAAFLTWRSEQLKADAINGKPVADDEIIRMAGAARRILATVAAKGKANAPGTSLAEYLNETYPNEGDDQ